MSAQVEPSDVATGGESSTATTNTLPTPKQDTTLQHRSEAFKTLVSSFVGAIIALILLPLSQATAFYINEYLSRPVLSIEYVEPVAGVTYRTLPALELQDVISSSALQALLIGGARSATKLVGLQHRDSVPEIDFPGVSSATLDFDRDAHKRLRQLVALELALKSPIDEKSIRSLVQQYSPQMAAMMPAMPSVQMLIPTIAPQIDGDIAALRDGLGRARRLRLALERPFTPRPAKVWLKVSVVNRGSSAGLIRNSARLKFLQERSPIELRRGNGPQSPQPEPANSLPGVPVNVLNTPATEVRTTDIAKVDAHSVAEFWFEVDESTRAAGSNSRQIDLSRVGVLNASVLLLFDHENRSIGQSISSAVRSGDSRP